MTNTPLAEPEHEVRVPEWTFADKLRKARQTIKVQQREMAERIGSSPYAYAQWEAGNSTPRDIVPLALRVEAVTGVPAWWLLGMPDPGKPTPARGGSSTPGPVYLLPHLDSNQEPIDSQPEARPDSPSDQLAPIVRVHFGGRPQREVVAPQPLVSITERRVRATA